MQYEQTSRILTGSSPIPAVRSHAAGNMPVSELPDRQCIMGATPLLSDRSLTETGVLRTSTKQGQTPRRPTDRLCHGQAQVSAPADQLS